MYIEQQNKGTSFLFLHKISIQLNVKYKRRRKYITKIIKRRRRNTFGTDIYLLIRSYYKPGNGNNGMLCNNILNSFYVQTFGTSSINTKKNKGE